VVLLLFRVRTCLTWFVIRTLRRSVLESIAKPSHSEASVLCKVLGILRRVFIKILLGFLV
jgi:hypothetical protein